MTLRRYWHEMTTGEFDALEPGRAIAVLPVAAIEQHGPHLPVYVDACLNEGVLNRALELMPADLPVVVQPAMKVGKSDEHIAFPGTLTLSALTLTRLWTEIGESVSRAGVRKMVLFNSHGGQPQIMDIVARDLRGRLGMFVVALSWFSFGVPDGLYSEDEKRHGIHGGEIETSMMLHLRPDLVHMDKAADFTPASVDLARRFRHLTPEGRIGYGWQTQDLHPAGACGNAAAADAARGRQTVEHAAAKLVELLHEVDEFPLDMIKERER